MPSGRWLRSRWKTIFIARMLDKCYEILKELTMLQEDVHYQLLKECAAHEIVKL